MAEAPASSPEEITLPNREYKYRWVGGSFGGDGVYYKRGNEYYPHFTVVGKGRFYDWGIKDNDVLLSAEINGVNYPFGDDQMYNGTNKYKKLNEFKQALRKIGTVTGINLKVLQKVTPTDKTQTEDEHGCVNVVRHRRRSDCVVL